MSLLDDVSIVVTPNGYKAGELYAVIPVPTEGSNQVINGDFATDTDWTKAANWTISSGKAISNGSGLMYQTSVSYVDGKTYKVTFDADITSGSGSVRLGNTSSETAFANGVNEFYLQTNASNTTRYIFFQGNSFIGTIDNVSVKEYTSADMDVTRATAATRVDENGLVNYAEVLGGEEVPSIIGILNAGGGTITQISGNSYSSTSDGTSGSGIRPKFDFNTTAGKRYKLTITPTGTISGTINFDFYDGSSYLFQNYDFTTTKEIYFIDNGSVFGAFDGAKTYDVSSFTVSVKEVTRDNVPRIDYTGGGCPHILAEPQRTNLVPYSEDFSNADWGNASLGTTPVLTSGFTSPDGTDNAYKISNANQNSMWLSATLIGASDSRTIYARTVSGTGTAQLLSHNSNTNNTFNLTEEWQRFEVSTTTSGTGATSYYAVDFRGSGTLNELLIWGAQAEVGSYPTSYIPNFGTAAGVTRNQDIFTRDGIGSLINSTEGVLFLEYQSTEDSNLSLISISDGTDGDIVTIGRNANSTNIYAGVRSNSGNSLYYSSSAFANTSDFIKVAVKWKVNDFAVWVNGTEASISLSGNAPIGLSEINFYYGNALHTFFGKVKQLQVYDTALTDEQLLQLTGESGTDFYESYAEMASALTYTIQ